ncbi:DUF421 domain-containing protein [Pleomorphovibrio marinus]|uniref:DUF421 domain-containing protein n=1 Tax=Pleomorphovibrio marinus TaxID=2164132 RepID=UPI000E0BC177|nr:YetF domain-containing protein [Pleomorphovibrio marinus]
MEPRFRDEIVLWDWHRILIGDAPAIFLVEVFIRTAVIYLCLVVSIRIMGKRMGGMLSLSELAVMITLGAFVAVPMQLQDRGLLFGITAFMVAIFFQRGISYIGIKSSKFENITKGRCKMLVKDGKPQKDALKNARISKNQLFALLRNEGITHLGEVKRMYLEAAGMVSIYKNKGNSTGQSIVPSQTTKINLT